MVGIFCIPRQDRPFYLSRDYGTLKRDTVYVRRGSSTAIAAPEEVARMGADGILTQEKEVSLSIHFVSDDDHTLAGREIAISTVNLQVIGGTIPDYGPPRHVQRSIWDVRPIDPWMNRDYYREYAEYLKRLFSASRLRLSVTNTGTAPANDVKLVLRVASDESQLILFDSEQAPEEPDRSSLRVPNTIQSLRFRNGPDVVVEAVAEGWQATARIPKVQPKDTVLTDSLLYIGAKTTCQVTFNATVYCDELRTPASTTLSIAIGVEQKTLAVKELLKNLGQ